MSTTTVKRSPLPDPRARTAAQQPDWDGHPYLPSARERLALSAPLVSATDVRRLRSLLARVAAGEAMVVQAGDCAEDPAQCVPEHVAARAGLLQALAGLLELEGGRPVVRVGRIAGQFAKPRSRPTETVAGRELPVYRGHMVNLPDPDPLSRAPDPSRMTECYGVARRTLDHLGWSPGGPPRTPEVEGAGGAAPVPWVWTSHEALLLDYELPLVRTGEDGVPWLSSTHWPWIGERTRQPEGAHVALLSGVANPVSCKVGPSTSVPELLELCAALDPLREPGRLTLIARMGAGRVAGRLPELVAAVRAAGHPVIWLTDPMHGNTVSTASGHKTRHLDAVIEEVTAFQRAVRTSGGVAGGLHLETTPDPVLECVSEGERDDQLGSAYTTFCDPRLNLDQAVSVVSAWQP